MIVDKRIWFVTWVHGQYPGEFKTLTENGKHGSWNGFGMIWKTSRHIVSVFPPPGIEETDIFGWDNLLWPPAVHPATEFSDYFALNLLKMACFNGFFLMFHTSQWVDECHQYIIAHPSDLIFHFPGGQLAQRWRGHFWRVGEKTERQFLLEKMQLKLETIHDTLKKLDLLFKLQLTINFPNSWIGWNLEWIH